MNHRFHDYWVAHTPHWEFHSHWPVGAADATIGRVGMLAVAFGIGTAMATGVNCAVCQADNGASSSSSSGHPSSSSSHSTAGATAAGPRKTTQKPAASATAGRRAPAAVSVAPSSTSGSSIISSPVSGASITAATSTAVATAYSTPTDSTPPAPAALAAVGLLASRREKATATAPVAPTATNRSTGGASSAASVTAPTTSIELETMALSPSGSGKVVSDANASGGLALALTSAGSASTTVTLPASTGLVIRAKATVGSTAPNMTLSIDGVPFTTVVVRSTSWSDYTFGNVIPAGDHVLSLSSSNSTAQTSLYLDKVTTTTGSIGDEFLGASGSLPNSANWSVKTGSGWDPGIETYSRNNVALDGQGHLVIQAVKTKNGYTSGWVETTNKMSLGYGTITARILVPKGQGLWPAFWLKGADEDTNPWPASGEIDVLELPSTSTTIYSTLHGPIAGTTATQQAQIISTLPDLSTGYHDYWVTHLPDQITFGVDNITLGTLTPQSLAPGSTWVYNRPTQVILNLAVGGSWAGAPAKSTRFPAKMYVDSIRWDPATTV